MAAQLNESVRSHTFFDSPEGPNGSPQVRVRRRRKSAVVVSDDDLDETIQTEGYRGADGPPAPFDTISPDKSILLATDVDQRYRRYGKSLRDMQ